MTLAPSAAPTSLYSVFVQVTISGVSTLGENEESALESAVADALGPRADVVTARRRRRLFEDQLGLSEDQLSEGQLGLFEDQLSEDQKLSEDQRRLEDQLVAGLDVLSSRTSELVGEALDDAVADGTLTSSMRHYGAQTDLATAEIVAVAVDPTSDSSSSSSNEGFSPVYVVVVVISALVVLAGGAYVVMRHAPRDMPPKRESRAEPDDTPVPKALKAPVTISPHEEILGATHELKKHEVIVGVDDIAIDEPERTSPERTSPEREERRSQWPGGSRELASFDI